MQKAEFAMSKQCQNLKFTKADQFFQNGILYFAGQKSLSRQTKDFFQNFNSEVFWSKTSYFDWNGYFGV